MITTSLEVALLVLTVEFALIAIGLGFSLWRGGRRQEETTLANVNALVSTVENVAAPRREALLAVLQDTYRFAGDEAEKVVTDFIEREHAFYNALIGVHLGRGGKTLADVPTEVTRLIAPWLRMTPRDLVDPAEVEALQNANTQLTTQLTETKEVLDELMNEYNAAFLRGQTEPMVRLDTAAEAADPTAEPDVPTTAGQASLGDVPDDELLSMDEVSPALSAVGTPAVPGADVEEDAVAEMLDQHVIDLDDDNDPAPGQEPEPLSQSDLDALMDNLGLDTPAPTGKAVPA